MLSITKLSANFMTKLAPKFGKAGLAIRNAAPEITLVLGIGAGTVGFVSACKASTKLDGIMTEHKEKVNQIHEYAARPEEEKEAIYTEKDEQHDITITSIQTGVKIAKLYAGPVALELLSWGLIIKGHNILRTRNAALTAAYVALNKDFKDYREGVIERFGKDLDKELHLKLKDEIVEKEVVDEKGKKKKVKETIKTSGLEGYSIYARFFEDGCRGWSKSPEYNLMFLKSEERYATDKLRSQGYLFLNEVYEALGIPATQAGQAVGWIFDPDDPTRDNKVDFGIYDVTKPHNGDFVNGYEPTIILDFNVDGPIYNSKIFKEV